MPLFYQQDINESTRLGVWHIQEEESFFSRSVPLQRNITHPHKRLQHLAGRYLLRFLFDDFPYNLIRIAETRLPANHEQMNSATTSGDIFTSSEIRMMQQQAAVFAGSGLISLPEELRSVVAQAVEAA